MSLNHLEMTGTNHTALYSRIDLENGRDLLIPLAGADFHLRRGRTAGCRVAADYH